VTLPRRHPRARWIALIFGAGLLLWLSAEEDQALPAVLLGGGLMLITVYFTLTKYAGGRRITPPAFLLGAALIGAGIGAGTALAAALLMVIKIGMHAHPFPDYPPGMILDTLRRAPRWALAGALSTLAISLLSFVRYRHTARL
jgi:hypothetical protein